MSEYWAAGMLEHLSVETARSLKVPLPCITRMRGAGAAVSLCTCELLQEMFMHGARCRGIAPLEHLLVCARSERWPSLEKKRYRPSVSSSTIS